MVFKNGIKRYKLRLIMERVHYIVLSPRFFFVSAQMYMLHIALLELAHRWTYMQWLWIKRELQSHLKKGLSAIYSFFYPSFSVVRNSSPNSLLFARMNTEKSWVEWKSQKKRKSSCKVKEAKSQKLFRLTTLQFEILPGWPCILVD